jgi:hypothetical protein
MHRYACGLDQLVGSSRSGKKKAAQVAQAATARRQHAAAETERVFAGRLAGLSAAEYRNLAISLHRTLLTTADPAAAALARDAVLSTAAAAAEARARAAAA